MLGIISFKLAGDGRRMSCRTIACACSGREEGNTFEVTMKTQGEIEAAICEGINRFEQEYMGRGPKDIRAYLLGDLLVVRLQGVLTAAEQHLDRKSVV